MSQNFHALKVLGLLAGLLLNPRLVGAQELTQSKSVQPRASALPHCVDDAATLSSIDEGRKQNAKNEFKYDKIKAALASDSDQELKARLVYSETLAANCPELKDAVLPAIATVIQNRIAIRNGDVKSVVFQRDQFASSLNGYDESKWRDFLCPSDKSLWERSKVAAEKSTVAAPLANNYYLYKHSTRFSPPAWAKDPVKFAGSDKIADCVQLFPTKFK